MRSRLMLITCTLEPLGYRVTETFDGLSAIAAYETALREGHPYDLVISECRQSSEGTPQPRTRAGRPLRNLVYNNSPD